MAFKILLCLGVLPPKYILSSKFLQEIFLRKQEKKVTVRHHEVGSEQNTKPVCCLKVQWLVILCSRLGFKFQLHISWENIRRQKTCPGFIDLDWPVATVCIYGEIITHTKTTNSHLQAIKYINIFHWINAAVTF